jgi:hypothetical protein
MKIIVNINKSTINSIYVINKYINIFDKIKIVFILLFCFVDNKYIIIKIIIDYKIQYNKNITSYHH